MREIQYELFPEAYGSEGKFIDKSGTVADLIIDTGMLMCSDYDKKIPIRPVLNKLLMKGCFPRSGEWEPFELSVEEYNEVVEYLINLPLSRPFRISDNTYVHIATNALLDLMIIILSLRKSHKTLHFLPILRRQLEFAGTRDDLKNGKGKSFLAYR